MHLGCCAHCAAKAGDSGAGLEYRFTPHIGLFSDVRYDFVNQSKNNFLVDADRFALRFLKLLAVAKLQPESGN